MPTLNDTPQKRAVIRVCLKPTKSTQTYPASITQLLAALNLSATRVDRRPYPNSIPFYDVYFVEVQDEGETTGAPHDNELNAYDSWARHVEHGMERVRGVGGEAHLLGMW